MAESAQVLDLDLITKHWIVKVDGKAYELRGPDALPLFDYRRANEFNMRIRLLFAKDRLSKQEEFELETKLDKFCRMVLLAPDRIHDKLKPVQRMQVYTTFFNLPQSGMPKAATPKLRRNKQVSRSIGAKSSRGSNASTAVTQ